MRTKPSFLPHANHALKTVRTVPIVLAVIDVRMATI
jgi:hypothetical protein